MASVHREALINAPAAQVWAALQDVGALHTRLVPGFVTSCRLEGEARLVGFANGMQAKELIVDINEALLWIADLLPHELAPAIAGMIEQGLAAMKRFQETQNANGPQPTVPPST